MLQSPQTGNASGVSAQEAEAIAEAAFIFGLPLVYIATQTDVMTQAESPRVPFAPRNQFVQYRAFPDAGNKEMVGINVDTLYSLASLDLNREPWVLSVPEMGKRWWLMQLVDAWNDVFGDPGMRTVGGKGGNFVLMGPHWKGSLPEGLTPYRSDTDIAMIGGRTYTAGKADDAAVHALQDQYTLTPLSQWGRGYRPPSKVPLKPGVDAKTPVPRQVSAMSADTFFSRLCSLLKDNPARAADAPVMTRMAKLGIAPAAPFNMGRFEPDVRKAIERGVASGQRKIFTGQGSMGEKINGWQCERDLGRYGTRYAFRAKWTYFAVGGNLVEDAFYPLCQEDAEGQPLSGDNRYVLRFRKDQIPPVNAFWSVTAYDDASYLIPNALNRYARGDRDALKREQDGSLTIYLQTQSPGADKEDNWLPCAPGNFLLVLRLYGPKKEVAEGLWKPPAVQKVH